MRVRAFIAATAIVAMSVTGVALAGAPVKGGVYVGKIKRTATLSLAISFKVNATGTRVSNFTFSFGYPIYCQGGGFGSPQPGSAKISKRGTFTAKLPLYFAPAHAHQGFVIVTGKFGSHGKESGKVKTDFTKSKTCNGTSRYSTKG